MTMHLLDTNVVSELRKGQRADPAVTAWFVAASEDEMFLSVITDFELEYGVCRLERSDPRQAAPYRQWLTGVRGVFGSRTLPITAPIAQLSARLRVPDPRPLADALIAATALHHGLTVVTRNERDFDLPGLTVLNPFR